MSRKKAVFSMIDSLRERYVRALPGKESLATLLSEAEVVEQVYNSNAIENSTLSLEETEKILLQIDLDRFISERELFEAKNLARVVTYIQTKAKSEEMNLDMLLLLHKMLISNIRDDIAGRFRQDTEYVRVGNYIAPPPDQVIPLLSNMFTEYHAKNSDSIVTRIARLHLMFEHIHPFVDGNGRIGRVLNNYTLIREGYVPINIKFIDRARYYDAFKAFDVDRNVTLMEDIVGKALTNSYHKRLAYLEGKRIISLAEYAQERRLGRTNVINKAHRQTIEAFLENGVWKIGI
jgi:Fic family protein